MPNLVGSVTRNRLFALIVVATLIASAIGIWGGSDADGSTSVEALRTSVVMTSSTLAPPIVFDMTAVAKEEDVIEDAVSEAAESLTTLTTSTTSTTMATNTTTLPQSTSPPETSSRSNSSPTTSPPTTSPPTTASGGYVSSAEGDFASRINSYRSGNGLSGLSRDGALDSYARSWAQTLAERGELSHSDIGSLLGSWSAVGENVGMGGSVDGIFDALASSAGHRDNMLGDFTHFGIGVYQDSGGTLWTAHVFTR